MTPDLQTYPAGQEIKCEVNGNPAPKVTWKLGGKEVASGDGMATFVVREDMIGVQNTLSCQSRYDSHSSQLTKNITFKATGRWSHFIQ